MLLVSPPKKPTMSDEVFPAELVDELALVRDALHFAVSWLGWRKWLRASGLLEWCSTGVLVPSGCGTFAPFWQYESDWATYLSRLRLDRRRVAGDSPFSPYTVLGGEEEFSREDEERIARLVMRRRSLERLEREWCRNNSHALRRVRPALLVFRAQTARICLSRHFCTASTRASLWMRRAGTPSNRIWWTSSAVWFARSLSVLEESAKKRYVLQTPLLTRSWTKLHRRQCGGTN